MVEYRVRVYKDRTEWLNLDGKLHREDGPAVEWSNGTKLWYIDGNLHRLDGHAVEWPDGSKQWRINNEKYTEEKFNAYIKKLNKPCAGKKVIVDGVEYELK